MPRGPVTVVMITRNRRSEATAAVASLRSLPDDPTVVVVDNGSADGTAEELRRAFPDVTVVPWPHNLGAAGRNIGVELATTEYVAFCDDDSGWEPGALHRAARILDEHPDVGLLAARISVGDATASTAPRTDPVCAEMAASPLGAADGLPGPSILGFVACGAVVRREAFLGVGGFHPRFEVGGEEDLLALDLATAGWSLVYADAVAARHAPSDDRDRAKRSEQVARNDLWVAWLRRPPGGVARRTWALVRRAVADRHARRGAVRAVTGLPWVVRERRVVPDETEAALRRLGR